MILLFSGKVISLTLYQTLGVTLVELLQPKMSHSQPAKLAIDSKPNSKQRREIVQDFKVKDICKISGFSRPVVLQAEKDLGLHPRRKGHGQHRAYSVDEAAKLVDHLRAKRDPVIRLQSACDGGFCHA